MRLQREKQEVMREKWGKDSLESRMRAFFKRGKKFAFHPCYAFSLLKQEMKLKSYQVPSKHGLTEIGQPWNTSKNWNTWHPPITLCWSHKNLIGWYSLPCWCLLKDTIRWNTSSAWTRKEYGEFAVCLNRSSSHIKGTCSWSGKLECYGISPPHWS